MIETWFPIDGYGGAYEVSDHGRVRSIARTRVFTDGRTRAYPSVILAGQVGTHGYRAVALADGVDNTRTVVVHRLVAEAFLPEMPGKTWVNHIDGDKLNNAVSNLEWCTPKENTEHMMANGLARFARGSETGMAKLSESDVVVIRSLALRGVLQKKLAANFGVAAPVISNICARKAWKHVA